MPRRDRTVRIWDLETGTPLHAVPLTGDVRYASFSPDGRWLVTAGPVAAGVWDTRAGHNLLLLRGASGPLTAAWFGKDGRTIYATSEDGTLRSYVCGLCGTPTTLQRIAAAKLKSITP